jgi:CDP-paratose 2-epimerase
MIAGPWQFGKVDQGVVSLWVQAHAFGRPLQYLGYGGGGKQVRDVLHVDDLADLVMEQLQDFPRWDGWVGNVAGGAGNSASLVELTRLCEDITGRKTVISASRDTRRADLRIFIGDCRRLHARTAWRPHRTVSRVIEDLASWILEERVALEALHDGNTPVQSGSP